MSEFYFPDAKFFLEVLDADAQFLFEVFGGSQADLQDATLSAKVDEALGRTGLGVLDKHQETLLAKAALAKNPQHIEFLLERGANIHQACRQGNTLLHYAASVSLENSTTPNAKKCVQLLLAYGAHMEAINEEGYSPLSGSLQHHALSVNFLHLMGGGIDSGVRWP